MTEYKESMMIGNLGYHIIVYWDDKRDDVIGVRIARQDGREWILK